jgi:Mn2+/Fe2+ NRAMP family transporter
MKVLVNSKVTTLVASLVAGLIVSLNLYLLSQVFGGG